jgi:hypothetical protein
MIDVCSPAPLPGAGARSSELLEQALLVTASARAAAMRRGVRDDIEIMVLRDMGAGYFFLTFDVEDDVADLVA